MKITDLQNAVEGIDFNNEKQEELLRALKAGKRRGGLAGALRIAASIAVCLATVGILSVPVRAVVSSLVKERMEEQPQEEVTKLAEEIQSQRVDADGKTREYTAGEKERKGRLYAQYLEGLFPEQELVRVDSEEEAAAHEFCFLTTTGVFYLPANRELTDEEILQQIDFEKKRDYALEEQHAEEIAKRKEAERQQIKELTDAGGITEEQAVETAEGYLQRLFGLDGSGMERNQYYQGEDENIPMYSNTYCVNWSDMGNYKYYYFHIDALDGTLRAMTYNDGQNREVQETVTPSSADAPAKAEEMKGVAERFLREKLDMQESYQEVKTYYLVRNPSGVVSRLVDVLFVREDGTADLVSCRWDGMVSDYLVTTKEDCEESLKSSAKAIAERHKKEEGEEIAIEIVEN